MRVVQRHCSNRSCHPTLTSTRRGRCSNSSPSHLDSGHTHTACTVMLQPCDHLIKAIARDVLRADSRPTNLEAAATNFTACTQRSIITRGVARDSRYRAHVSFRLQHPCARSSRDVRAEMLACPPGLGRQKRSPTGCQHGTQKTSSPGVTPRTLVDGVVQSQDHIATALTGTLRLVPRLALCHGALPGSRRTSASSSLLHATSAHTVARGRLKSMRWTAF